jgi:hypothetical protein
MKISLVNLFSILFVFSLISSVILPAYAEVTSIQTNTAFYKGGNQIIFSGKTAPGDSPYVTVVIYDPNNKFVLLSSGITDSNNAYQIMVDTSIQSNQPKFSLKGIYNATAFVMNQAAGKTVSFVFSPDGSPIIPSSPTNLKAIPYLSTEIDLSWSAPVMNGGSSITGYQIERDSGNGFNVIKNSATVTYQDTGLTPSKQYSYRVSAINSAGISNTSNVVYATTTSAPVQTIPQGSPGTSQNNTGTTQTTDAQAIYEEIQKRIENAKRLQQLMQEKSKKVLLNENMNLGDSIGNTSASNMGTTSESKPLSIDFNNILYPLIALAGAGMIAAVLYAKKNKLWFNSDFKPTNRQNVDDSMKSVEKEDDFIEEDYSLMILKNRLAKGEITIEEFNRLKDALKEP